VIYLPGNHDAPLQKYDGLSIGDIKVVRETVHTTEHGMYINDGD
jgi:UDP-2,3-diacylglucosamine pyrophosphatase LpxH